MLCLSILLLMMKPQSEDEFVRLMSDLEGRDFEDETCSFLQRIITDFQTVPANPSGDAGLDGHSHAQTIAYCCYGPAKASKETTAKLRTAVIEKFRGDLRTLFEIEIQGKGKKRTLSHCETAEMKTILATGKKLDVIRLVVSVFEDHRVLGSLHDAFNEYKSASKCRYIDAGAKLTIWGPKQLAQVGAVDDLVIAKLEQREIVRRITASMGSQTAKLPVPTNSSFDAKFDWLEAQKKLSADAVTRLRTRFRARWSTAITVENDLANNAPQLHAALATAREEAAADADLASGTAPNPAALLELMRTKLAERLEQHLGARFPPEIRNQLVDGEIGRLIGECPVDWRPT
jgi:hypothetical protein